MLSSDSATNYASGTSRRHDFGDRRTVDIRERSTEQLATHTLLGVQSLTDPIARHAQVSVQAQTTLFARDLPRDTLAANPWTALHPTSQPAVALDRYRISMRPKIE
jgi:hypothetical protein